MDCLFEGIPLSGCLFADYCCSSPFARSYYCFSLPLLGFCQEKSSLLVCCQLLAPRRKQLPVSQNLSFLRSSPCFLPCFPSCCCCWLQSATPFSAMSSLCFLNVVSLYSSKAHPCPQKVQQLQVEADFQEQPDSRVLSCAASKCPSVTADLPWQVPSHQFMGISRGIVAHLLFEGGMRERFFSTEELLLPLGKVFKSDLLPS